MSSSHLTDDQLQSYLDGNHTAGGIEEHLKSCAHCRQALAAYKSLYSAMAEDPGAELAPNFADAVMARLPRREVVAERESISDSVLLFAVFGVGIAAVIYFLRPAALLETISKWFGLSALLENQYLADVTGHLSRIDTNTAFILGTVLALVGIALVDHLITRHKRQQKPISYLISI